MSRQIGHGSITFDGVVSTVRNTTCIVSTTADFCAESDIVHLKLIGRHIFVINSATGAKEFFERRAAIYSDRYVQNKWLSVKHHLIRYRVGRKA